MEKEPFSNPLAPPSLANSSHQSNASLANQSALTNDDFRKLMMTPRAVSNSAGQGNVPGSVRGSVRSKHHSKPFNQNSESSENQKKKKKFFESMRKHEDDILSDLAKRYRDRAKERREGVNSEHGNNEPEAKSNTAYHAVGPDNFDMNATERRKQIIQESKYLGGDIEHTHLVKGLDYALLHKVKAEIQTKDDEERYVQLKKEEEAKKEEELRKKNQAGLSKLSGITFDDSDRYAVKSKIAESILKAVFNSAPPERNELFVQGRMAYQYDLVDEFPESDIPTTIIRSKAECPNLDAYNSVSTNEIVINKLVQIWLYIRQGGAGKKTKKPKLDSKFEEDAPTLPDGPRSHNKPKLKGDDIYDDVGDYVPSIKPKRSNNNCSSSTSHFQLTKDRQIEREVEEKRASYFDTKKADERGGGEEDDMRSSHKRALELAASVVGAMASTSNATDCLKLKRKSAAAANQSEMESYAECYPGAPENDDAILDSDDEVDFTKMDTGGKKGMVNRWDFDSVEEYGDYMSNREAMPKAAFQYGVKMGDGRKSKRLPSKKEEKAKLDRDLQKINAIIAKRKKDGTDIGLSFIAEKKSKS